MTLNRVTFLLHSITSWMLNWTKVCDPSTQLLCFITLRPTLQPLSLCLPLTLHFCIKSASVISPTSQWQHLPMQPAIFSWILQFCLKFPLSLSYPEPSSSPSPFFPVPIFPSPLHSSQMSNHSPVEPSTVLDSGCHFRCSSSVIPWCERERERERCFRECWRKSQDLLIRPEIQQL